MSTFAACIAGIREYGPLLFHKSVLNPLPFTSAKNLPCNL